LRKPLPKKLVSALQLKKMKYNDSREVISKMYDLFDLPHGSVEYEKILKGLGQSIGCNLEAHEVLRLRRKVLDHRLRDGTISNVQYQLKIAKLMRKHHQLGRQLHLLEKRRMLEEQHATKSTAFHDEDSLLGALQRLIFFFPKGPRKSKDQTLMKRKTIELYGLKAPRTMECHDELYWDVVAGQYLPRDNMVCAHIVPRSISNQVVNFVCGPGTADDLDTYTNALCLPKAVEKAMDKGEVIIVPVDPTEVPVKRFVLRLALSGAGDAKAYWTGPGWSSFVRVKDLDGRELVWPNDLRPKLRFLYFRWIYSITINHLYKKHLVVRNFDELKTREAWMTVGPWLRKSVLLEMAKYSDCMDDEEIEKVLGRIEDESLDARARSLVQLVGHTVMGDNLQNKEMELETEEIELETEEMELKTEEMDWAQDIFYDSDTETREEYKASIRGPISGIADDSDAEEEL
jgi:hypothetical protein